MKVLLSLALLLAATSAQEWDGFKVKYGMPLIDWDRFTAIPRTSAEAIEEGWVLSSACGESSQFVGNRYIKDDDYALLPLYDANGFVAGLQVALPSDIDGYPYPTLQPPFVLDEGLNMYTLTAYFVDPAIICGSGRTEEEFASQGTGDRLVFQWGEELRTAPATPEEAEAEAPWARGQCYRGMGLHYWGMATPDIPCEEALPFFLLYNNGKLNSFGWAFQTQLTNSIYEHPPVWAIAAFFPDEYPSCFDTDIPHFSTLHIYMTDDPSANHC